MRVVYVPERDAKREVIGWIASVQDITERVQAESALRITLQRFYAVLASMYSGVLLVTDEGRVEFTNQAFCNQFGLKDAPDSLVGLSSRDMLEKIQNGYLHPDQAAARIREILDRRQPRRALKFARPARRSSARTASCWSISTCASAVATA